MENCMEKVLEIIKQIKPQLKDLDEDTILTDGMLDSLDVITMVNLLEKEFQVKIVGVCFKKENFETPHAIL